MLWASACWILISSADTERVQGVLMVQSAFEVVMAALKLHAADPEVVEHGLAILKYLAVKGMFAAELRG